MHPTYTPDPYYGLWRRKKTQVEMVAARGFIISDEEEDAISSKENFKQYFDSNKANMDNFYAHESGSDTLSVIFNILMEGLITKKETIAQVHRIIDAQFNDKTNGATSFLLIVDDIPKTEALVKDLTYTIEFFIIADLAVNPTTHIFTQYHRIMATDEKNQFYKTTGFETKHIPGIPRESAVMRFFNAKEKDLIHIKRDPILTSSIITTHDYYREVRNIPIVSAGMGAQDEDENDEDLDIEENVEEDFGAEY